MANYQKKIILDSDVSFIAWRASLQAKLARCNVLGHVFHNFPGIKPACVPIDPNIKDPKASNELSSQYLDKLEKWTLGKIESKKIIISRLSSVMCPQATDHMTARELYDTIAGSREETATAPYASALDNLMSLRFTTTANDYIDRFLATLQSVNNAADALTLPDNKDQGYRVGEGQASAILLWAQERWNG